MNEIEELIKEIEDDIFAYPSDSPKEEYAPTSDFKYGYNQASRGFLKSLQKLKRTLDQDIEDQREITDKVVAYDQLDHKFKLVCGKGVQEVLRQLYLVGFGNEITEQQALNKLAERFPMTTNQIVSTLEMSQTGVNHEPIEVPECFEADYKKHAHLEHNKSEFLLTAMGGIYRTAFQNQFKELHEDTFKTGIKWNGWSPETILWASRNYEAFCKAAITGNYTVAKEPLYRVKLPRNQFNDEGGVMETEYAYLIFNKTSEEFDLIGSPFDGKERTTNITESIIKDCDERYWAFAVPVEEEAE